MIDFQVLKQKYHETQSKFKDAYKEVVDYKKKEDKPDFDETILFFLYARYLHERREFVDISKLCEDHGVCV